MQTSARKNCSTPKSRLLDTVRADANKIFHPSTFTITTSVNPMERLVLSTFILIAVLQKYLHLLVNNETGN